MRQKIEIQNEIIEMEPHPMVMNVLIQWIRLKLFIIHMDNSYYDEEKHLQIKDMLCYIYNICSNQLGAF